MAVKCPRCNEDFDKDYRRCINCGAKTKRLVVFKEVKKEKEQQPKLLPPYLAG
jgi:predicted amidophosphoribosyltransferase